MKNSGKVDVRATLKDFTVQVELSNTRTVCLGVWLMKLGARIAGFGSVEIVKGGK